MRHLAILILILACSVFAGVCAWGQHVPQSVSLIRLIASPEKFDGKLVTVRGFLVADWSGHDNHAVGVLYLYKEDADNDLGNSVLVIPNEQMRRDAEKINRMYVILTGTFRNGIRDVQNCSLLSDPNRPARLKKKEGIRYK